MNIETTASIWMITYNHENFISDALDSILMQEVNFKYEIVIGEDCSTDGTRELIKSYQLKYPDIIIPIFYETNVGLHQNFINVMNKCRGKYIALCEGDDFWTDPCKLQKQVDFLEINEKFSMACNSSSEVDQHGTEFKIAKREESVIDLAMLLREGWFIRTASIVFRREAIRTGFPDFFYTAYSTDYILQVMILKHGKCRYFPEVMSAYRHHPGGISQADKTLQLKRWITKIELLDTINLYTNNDYKFEIKEQQEKIKQGISFYLYRYPYLLNELGVKVYLQKGSLRLFCKEFIQRMKKRIRN